MYLQARLSAGLLHPAGTLIEANLANLPAGESKLVPLRVKATKTGEQACAVVVVADRSPDAIAKTSVKVTEALSDCKAEEKPAPSSSESNQIESLTKKQAALEKEVEQLRKRVRDLEEKLEKK
jgi:hypothetical protein